MGRLVISAHVANRLARAAEGHWPEPGPFPEEARRDVIRRLTIEWAVITCVVALFLTLAPMAAGRSKNHPPILAAILFPAIAVGVGNIVRFFRRPYYPEFGSIPYAQAAQGVL